MTKLPLKAKILNLLIWVFFCLFHYHFFFIITGIEGWFGNLINIKIIKKSDWRVQLSLRASGSTCGITHWPNTSFLGRRWKVLSVPSVPRQHVWLTYHWFGTDNLFFSSLFFLSPSIPRQIIQFFKLALQFGFLLNFVLFLLITICFILNDL